MDEKKEKTIDSAYIQQHLANERTYLAWVRTSITIIGVGFLITNLHYATLAASIEGGDILAKTIGLASIVVGLITILMTTIGYFKKGKEINQQTFLFPKGIVLLLSISLFIIFIIFGVYYLFVWGIM
ncbi:MAG: YidH family protein [Bacillaceae bacterium]